MRVIDMTVCPLLDTWRVEPDHPAFAGHFPGHPVVPGAILLDWAIAVAAMATKDVTSVRQARFQSGARPGTLLRLHAQRDGAQFRFAIVDEAGRTVCDGVLDSARKEEGRP